jgi:short subunit dehydrogenase-like uncharacterized protein
VKIAVYGSSGFTGSRVLQALSVQGVSTVSASRATLSLLDQDALRRFVASANVVVNCAGPFSETAAAIERAAIACGSRTLHLSCEQRVMDATFAQHGEALRADSVLCAAGGFSTLVAELAVWLASRTLGPLQTIALAVAHRGACQAPAPCAAT